MAFAHWKVVFLEILSLTGQYSTRDRKKSMQQLVVDLEQKVDHSSWVEEFNFIQNADLSLLDLYHYYWTLADARESFWVDKEEWTTVEGTSLVYRLLKKEKSVFRGSTVAGKIGGLAIAGSGDIKIDCGTVEVFDRPAQHAPADTWILVSNINLSLLTDTTYAQDVLVEAVIGTLSSSAVTKWFNGCTTIVPKLSLKIKPCGKGCLVTLFLEKLLPYIREEYSNSKNSQ